jgi:hypothetical protein
VCTVGAGLATAPHWRLAPGTGEEPELNEYAHVDWLGRRENHELYIEDLYCDGITGEMVLELEAAHHRLPPHSAIPGCGRQRPVAASYRVDCDALVWSYLLEAYPISLAEMEWELPDAPEAEAA